MVTATDVEYRVEDTAMVGRLALPDGSDKRPAVLIAHEGPDSTTTSEVARTSWPSWASSPLLSTITAVGAGSKIVTK